MKRVKKIIQCITTLLKKKFFNIEKTDINHNCKNAFSFDLNTGDFNNKEEAEEYLSNYKTTTRWQTV